MLISQKEEIRSAVMECLKEAIKERKEREEREGRGGREERVVLSDDDSAGANGKLLLVDDLGLESMEIAVTITQLEDRLQADPFNQEGLSFTEIRTVNDLCDAFTRGAAGRKN